MSTSSPLFELGVTERDVLRAELTLRRLLSANPALFRSEEFVGLTATVGHLYRLMETALPPNTTVLATNPPNAPRIGGSGATMPDNRPAGTRKQSKRGSRHAQPGMKHVDQALLDSAGMRRFRLTESSTRQLANAAPVAAALGAAVEAGEKLLVQDYSPPKSDGPSHQLAVASPSALTTLHDGSAGHAASRTEVAGVAVHQQTDGKHTKITLPRVSGATVPDLPKSALAYPAATGISPAAASDAGAAGAASAACAGSAAAGIAEDDHSQQEIPVKSESIGFTSTSRRCYICRHRYREIHHFYADMCMTCARFNYAKRQQSADLRGRIALVTGARVKIGYRIALKLLRCGATVLITTRFPSDATDRFLAEADSSRWCNRLHVLALDFRNARTVEVFAAYLCRRLTHLDILINNAAQTVRRPPAYYHHLIDAELSLQSTGIGPGSGVSAAKRAMLTEYFALLKWGNTATSESVAAADMLMGDSLGDKIDGMPRHDKPSAVLHIAASVTVAIPPDLLAARHSALALREQETPAITASSTSSAGTCGASASASASAGAAALPTPPTAVTARSGTCATEAKYMHPQSSDGEMSVMTAPVLSQVALLSEDAAATNAALFPQGAFDGTGQQLDLRAEHTWSMRLSDVPAVEAAEMMAINAIAPMVLTARLKLLLDAEPPSGHPSRRFGVERVKRPISAMLSAQAAFSLACAMRGDPSETSGHTAIARASTTGSARLAKAADSVAEWNASAISQAIAATDIGNRAAARTKTVAIPPQTPPQSAATASSSSAGAASSAAGGDESSACAEETGFDINTPAAISALVEELRIESQRPDRFVVQVTAREGMFSPSFKKPYHPHTNAAKAALHMVVRTSGADYASGRVFMTAVDTGWCSPMQPAHRAAAIEKSSGFLTPLDDVDGAARVLDPIITAIASSLHPETHKGLTKAPVWGVLLKHYAPHAW